MNYPPLRRTQLFLRSLKICIHAKPNDPRVLFMEGRLQLAMITMTDEHMAAINASEEVSLPKLKLLVAEQKLIKAIALQPDLIAGYIILALVRMGV